MSEYPFVSVIVPVLNREKFIGKCIESLLELDYPSYEIIVIDNKSTDRTMEIISKYPIKVFENEQRGSYVTRNKGVDNAKGDIIAFTDSDCVVDKNWLKNLVRNYTDDKIGGVCGEILSYPPKSIIEKFSDIIGINRVDLINQIVPKRKVELKRDSNIFLSAVFVTANCSFRREVFFELEKFDTEYISGGDVGFGWKVLKAGYKLIYDPEAVVWHKHRETTKALIKIFYKYGYDQPLLLKKQSEGRSYFKIKTYLFEKYEFGMNLPTLALINIDLMTLIIFTLILIPISPVFAYLSLFIFFSILLGTLRETVQAIKKTKELRWLILFPLLHIIRNYAFIYGRIRGGIARGVLSM